MTAGHPARRRLRGGVWRWLGLSALHYGFVAWCTKTQLGAERELLPLSRERWHFYTGSPKCFAILVLLTKRTVPRHNRFAAERLTLLFVFCLKVKQHQIPRGKGCAACPGRPPARCRLYSHRDVVIESTGWKKLEGVDVSAWTPRKEVGLAEKPFSADRLRSPANPKTVQPKPRVAMSSYHKDTLHTTASKLLSDSRKNEY